MHLSTLTFNCPAPKTKAETFKFLKQESFHCAYCGSSRRIMSLLPLDFKFYFYRFLDLQVSAL